MSAPRQRRHPTTSPTPSTTERWPSASSNWSAGEPLNLIEGVAARIADDLLARDGVKMVAVTVHKPQAPITVPFADVSVTIRRARREEPFRTEGS